MKELNQHTANVNSALFSPDGSKIITASNDNTAKLWDIQGNLLLNLDEHASAVNWAVFSPDGRMILTASYDSTARLWDWQGNLLSTLIHGTSVDIAIFSPDNTKILTLAVVPRLWDLKGQRLSEFKSPLEKRFRKHIGDYGYTSTVFSPDGSKILTVSNDNAAKLWDLEGNLLVQFNGHKGIINSAVFSPDVSRVLTASADNTVKLWDLQSNKLSDFEHKGIVNSAVFSPDGTRVLSASTDGTVKLRYTPEAIIQWLKTAKIPPLPREEKNLNGMNF